MHLGSRAPGPGQGCRSEEEPWGALERTLGLQQHSLDGGISIAAATSDLGMTGTLTLVSK